MQGSFRGLKVLSMPPPSSGGVTLIQMLNLLEPMDLKAMGLNSAESIHTLVEAMNLAYRDRNSELGDPDQVAVPVQRLTSKAYADSLRPLIRAKQHTPSAALGGTAPLPANSTNTTHLSVADQQGSLVALTTTLNFAYGNGVAIPGTGVLLKTRWMTSPPCRRPMPGLVRGKERHRSSRRPLSSMTPCMVLKAMAAPGSPPALQGAAASSPRRCRSAQPHGARPQLGHISVESASTASSGLIGCRSSRALARQHRFAGAGGHTIQRSRAMGSANSVEASQGGSLGALIRAGQKEQRFPSSPSWLARGPAGCSPALGTG